MDVKNEFINTCNCITKEVIGKIIKKCIDNGNVILKSHKIYKASDKMLGFLADYWKLQIQVTSANNTKLLHFFIKAVSTSNAAKANMVKEMNLFEKEIAFYSQIKKKIDTAEILPWSPKLILVVKDAMVFEDLNYLQYKTRNKFEPFDENHTLLALKTLARFHASSFIYEEKVSKQLGKIYRINDEHGNDLDQGGYTETDPWFTQCMEGSLEIVKTFSKYKNNEDISLIEKNWKIVWMKALKLADASTEYRNVVCHRDLWNNNMLFRYEESGLTPTDITPIDCLLVDFQAVRYQPPSGDVMLLLHCNLEHEYRINNTSKFLSYYYNELRNILKDNGVSIDDVMCYKDFLKSSTNQNLWGLIVRACILPQIWIDDELTLQNFCDTAKFEEILTKNKAKFIQSMMENDQNYKKKILQIFEEIVQDYCISNDRINCTIPK